MGSTVWFYLSYYLYDSVYLRITKSLIVVYNDVQSLEVKRQYEPKLIRRKDIDDGAIIGELVQS